ncbi:MAG: cupin domain-containing protein [Pseudomonadales bacterium]|nr:cupin domain-containing protein [Pseudomonadales bacterium]
MLNMDFSRRVCIDTPAVDWVASPSAGVWRKPLAREEAERGHATSIVRYDPGASFNSHNHPLGEEILVLEGTFSDATGDFHAGTYFRNPMGFVHAPFSREGCVILVKLHQFQPGDDTRLCIDTGSTAAWQLLDNGARLLPLHQFHNEKVLLMEWPAGLAWGWHEHEGGEEMYLIRGDIRDESGTYGAGTWLRNPPGSCHAPVALSNSLLWLKSGHLH